MTHSPWTNSQTKTERNEALRALMSSGTYTLQEIGDIYGISRERVRQLVKATAKERGKTGLLDPLRLMKLIRSDPNAMTIGYVAVRYYNRAATKGGDSGAVHDTLKALGVEHAVLRLFRLRKWRKRHTRQEKALALYRAFKDKHGRPPLYTEMVGWGVAIPGLFSNSKRSYVKGIRAAAGDKMMKAGGYLYVERGDIQRAIVKLAGRKQGVRAHELATFTGTSYASAHQSLKVGVSKGRLVSSDGRYFGLPDAGP